jgi:formylglycine-generating enzyme required for sulfatase activity
MTEEQVFLAALDLADPADRAAYLDRACGGDVELRRQVEDLLAAHFRSGAFLDEPVGPRPEAGPETPPARLVGDAETNAGKPDEAPDLRFLQPPIRPDSLGRIGHYEVLQVLGRGGFGIVFRAFDEVLQRVVALKVLAPTLAATSPARKRFLREARASAQVRHENVVQVYAVEEQPLPYLVMEFIPGETLQQRLDRTGPLDTPEVVRIGRQIAEGLAAAHATGLIHRDIKPANVLIESGHQRVKVTDFGLARTADEASVTQSGVLAGTPMYMAPEQARGEKLDHRADLFSLGSVLYVMASGRPPFRAATVYAVLKRVAEDTPRPIPEVIPEVPPWLCDLIAKLHAKKPQDRFQSAREVADVLADCEARLTANARLKDYPRFSVEKPAARRFGGWKWAAALALLLPVLVVGLTEITGVTHWLRSRQEPERADRRDGPDKGDGDRGGSERLKEKELPPEYTNTVGMTFKLIPAGKFRMGSSRGEIDRCLKEFADSDWANARLPAEGLEHEVEITQPFYMGVTEVTVGQFRQFMKEKKYTVDDWKQPGFNEVDDHPVVFIFWHNAVDFCKWLSEKDGKRYRLPTEAEWEYCCRAGKEGTRYCFGDADEQLENYAWYYKNSGGAGAPVGVGKPNPGGQMHPVGKLKANAWGLHDMHGNAWEWCQDNYDPDYYKSSALKDPLCVATDERGGGRLHWSSHDHVIRGGSCHWSPVFCRSAFRHNLPSDGRYADVGFRVLLVAPPAGVRKENGK